MQDDLNFIPTDFTEFDRYIRQGEPDQRERAQNWAIAIGLQAVDGLHVSDYLRQTAQQHIEGNIDIDEANSLIKNYYQSKTERQPDDDDKEEADKVSANISRLLNEHSFTFSVAGFAAIHRQIFRGVFKHAGQFREYDITKKEWVLSGDTVLYTHWQDLNMTLAYDIEQEKQFNYTSLDANQAIAHLAHFVSGIWQIHPFREGNTRTTAIFTIKYLRSIGFRQVNNELFEHHSWYFRNALVRANYRNVQKAVNPDNRFLVAFFRNLLLGESTPLHNREMHILWQEANPLSANDDFQSATATIQSANELSPKCKNCTLEELAVLRIIKDRANVTQRQIAAEIGKSERTVKSITVRLVQQGILRRENGKRNGYWIIVTDSDEHHS